MINLWRARSCVCSQNLLIFKIFSSFFNMESLNSVFLSGGFIKNYLLSLVFPILFYLPIHLNFKLSNFSVLNVLFYWYPFLSSIDKIDKGVFSRLYDIKLRKLRFKLKYHFYSHPLHLKYIILFSITFKKRTFFKIIFLEVFTNKRKIF